MSINVPLEPDAGEAHQRPVTVALARRQFALAIELILIVASLLALRLLIARSGPEAPARGAVAPHGQGIPQNLFGGLGPP